MQRNPQKNWSHKFMPKFSLDLQLWDNLKYHFTYGVQNCRSGAMTLLSRRSTISLVITMPTIPLPPLTKVITLADREYPDL